MRFSEIINEISRRDFLKGAGAATALAAMKPAGAGGIWIAVPSAREDSDPRLSPRSVKFIWNYRHFNQLNDNEKKLLIQLVFLLYIARLEDQQQIYKQTLEIINKLNDEFSDIHFEKSMNEIKKHLESLKVTDPEKFEKIKNSYLKYSGQIIINGISLAVGNTTDNRATQSTPQQNQKSNDYNAMMLTTAIRLYVYASLENSPEAPIIRDAIRSYMLRTKTIQLTQQQIKELQKEIENERQTNPQRYTTLSKQHLANSNQILKQLTDIKNNLTQNQ